MAKRKYPPVRLNHSLDESAGKLVQEADFLKGLPKDRDWTYAEYESLAHFLEAADYFRQTVVALLKKIPEKTHAKA